MMHSRHGNLRHKQKHDVHLHGIHSCTSAAMLVSPNGSEQPILGPEAVVPALLVDLQRLTIDVVEEARVADVQLVGRDADDGACKLRQFMSCQSCSARLLLVL